MRSYIFSKNILLDLLVVLVLVLSYGLMYSPVYSIISTQYLGGSSSDPGIYIYLMKLHANYFLNGSRQLFDAKMFYPYQLSLAYSDNFILPSAISSLVYRIYGNWYLAFNISIILSHLACAFFVYKLTDYFFGSKISAFYAGYAFLFLPFFYFHLGHTQLQYFLFIPATIFTIFKYFEKNSLIYGSAIGFLVLLEFLCSAYYAMYMPVMIGLFFILIWCFYRRSYSFIKLARLALVNLPWCICLLYFITPYLDVRKSFGEIPLSVVRMFSAKPWAYLAASSKNMLWGRLTHHLSHLESFLFVGFVNLFFALVCIYLLMIVKRRQQPKINILATIMLFVSIGFYFLFQKKFDTNLFYQSWGIALCCWGLFIVGIYNCVRQSSSGEASGKLEVSNYLAILFTVCVFFVFASFGISSNQYHNLLPELYYWLYQYMPGFNSMRGTSRIALLGILPFFILISYLFKYLIARLNVTTTWQKLILLLLPLLIVSLEFKEAKIASAPEVPIPDIYSELLKLPKDGAVVSLPFISMAKNGLLYSRTQTRYMNWTLDSGLTMVNGYSGKIPPLQFMLGDKLPGFPNRESMNMLGQIVGLKYVVYYKHHSYALDSRRLRKRLKKFSDQIEVLAKDRLGNMLLEIHPVLEVTKKTHTNYYIEPNADRERCLSIQISADARDSSIHEAELWIEFGKIHEEEFLKHHQDKYHKQIKIKGDGRTQQIALTVPKSTSRAKTQILQLNSNYLPDEWRVLVKNVQIRSCNDVKLND